MRAHGHTPRTDIPSVVSYRILSYIKLETVRVSGLPAPRLLDTLSLLFDRYEDKAESLAEIKCHLGRIKRTVLPLISELSIFLRNRR